MIKEIQEAWNKFFGKGWEVHQVPDKRECFEAGFEAARFLYQANKEPTQAQVILNREVKYEGE